MILLDFEHSDQNIESKVKMAAALASIHCLYAAKAVPMNGAPSSNADEAAFRSSAGK